MYKNNTKQLGIPPGYIYRILLIMRLTTVLLIATIMQVSAGSFAQKISLNEKNAPLEKIFDKIRLQSGYDFLFNRELLKTAKPVDINIKNADIEDALELCFKGQPFTYTLQEKTIVIKAKTPSFLERAVDRLAAIDVHGRVVDQEGKPLPGATVKVKGTDKSISANGLGMFELKNVEEEAILVISFVGYQPIEVSLKITGTGDNSIRTLGTIILEPSASKLDEVVVMAYGTTSTRLNTGNIVSVKSSDIEKQPVSNPLYTLQGRVPGLIVTPTTGLPGGAVKLQIRGKNSLVFQTEPLIVIDGLPIVSNIEGLGHQFSDENNVGITGGGISSLNFINPNDIESIDVLKDADATSIYGSRGANGVILITTKKGKEGKTKVDINMQGGVSVLPRKLKLLNTDQYIDLRKEAFLNSGLDINDLPASRNNMDLKLWDQHRYTDWQDVLLGRTAKYNDFQGSVSGGNTNVQYNIGGNYHRETTVFDGSNADQKGSARISLTGVSSNQKFRVNLNASYLLDKNTLPGVDFTNAALTLPPNAPSLYNEDGSLNWAPLTSGAKSWDNPYAELNRVYDASVKNLLASADLSYKLLTSLTLKTTLGYNELNGEAFLNRFPFKGRAQEEMGATGLVALNTNGAKSVSIEPQISYKQFYGKATLQGLIGGSIQNSTSKSQLLTASGFTSDALVRNLASATSYNINNNSSQYRYVALFSRFSFNWDNKYLVNLSARRDGSSRFGPGKQFGNFGSFGSAYVFSEEKYIKSTLPFISFGKLRLSYGVSGNDGIGDYQYFEKYQIVDASDPYLGVKGYQTSGIFNSDYAWESSRKLETGLDLGFSHDRILLSTSYFRNRSSKQIINYPYPSIVGPGWAKVNSSASIQNAGIEIVLNTQNIQSANLKWSTTFNFSRIRNKLLSYPGAEIARQTIGQPFYGQAAVYIYSGVNRETGKYQFKNSDGSLVFETPDITTSVLTEPRFYGNLSNSISFKRFSLDIFLQFTKQMGLSYVANYSTIAGRAPRNLPVEYAKRWQKPGDNSDIQKIYGILIPDDFLRSANTLQSSSFRYEDASFIRLKNLSLSYDLPDGWTKKYGLEKIRMFLHGQNLWTITKYSGFDPETQSVNSLPPLKIWTAGLQITL
jgi:TonB-linked SusC/RagA family outer membrane protein